MLNTSESNEGNLRELRNTAWIMSDLALARNGLRRGEILSLSGEGS